MLPGAAACGQAGMDSNADFFGRERFVSLKRYVRPRRHQALGLRVDPAPIVAAAVEATERAGFDAQRIPALDIDGAEIAVAAGVAVDVAAPLLVGLRLHIDQDGLALVVRGRVEHVA